jgi:hypothetical protein
MNRDACVNGPISDYREFPPPSPLANYLLCLWTQRIVGSPGEFAQRVLPDGCLDILLINGEAPMVIGPWTEPFTARLASGTMIVGARCHPGCAPGLLGLSASTLLNQSVALRDIWGSAASARLARIAGESTFPARRLAMEAVLLASAPVRDGSGLWSENVSFRLAVPTAVKSLRSREYAAESRSGFRGRGLRRSGAYDPRGPTVFRRAADRLASLRPMRSGLI